MPLRIAARLFLAALLGIAVVFASGIALVRWTLLDADAHRPAVDEAARLAMHAQALERAYAARGDWSFLRHERAMRDVLAMQAGGIGATRGLPNFSDRLGLLDSQGHTLAGVVAHPLLVTLASIDTQRLALRQGDRLLGYLVLAKAQSPSRALSVAFLLRQQRGLAVIALISLLLSAVGAAVLAAHFRRPIAQLAKGALRLEQGDLDARVVTTRRDELGDLARSFNRLAGELQQAEQQRRRWIADTSHELRTPLAVLRAQLDAFEDGIRPVTPRNLALVSRQLSSLGRLVDDLQTLASGDANRLELRCEEVDLWQQACDELGTFAPEFESRDLAVSLGAAPGHATIHADPVRVRQILGNVLRNSQRYTEAGGRVELAAHVDALWVTLTIDDSAPGVPDAVLLRLGERFFRADASRSRAGGGADWVSRCAASSCRCTEAVSRSQRPRWAACAPRCASRA